MNFNTAEAELRKFFNTGWASATSIAWPDVEFSIPESATWVRFNCQENEGRQVSMGDPGNNRFRHFGIVTIQIFQPLGDGSIDARTKAATALGIFMGAQTENGITFTDCYARQIGNDGHGFYQVNVFAPFWYDEIT